MPKKPKQPKKTPKPSMLGTGTAHKAAKVIMTRRARIAEALREAGV